MTSVFLPRLRCVLQCNCYRPTVFRWTSPWFAQASRAVGLSCNTYQRDDTKAQVGETSSNKDVWQKITVFQKSVIDSKMTIAMDISVMDTHKHKKNTDVPTVLGLHGVPEHSDDLEPLITQLKDRGIRFISPIFPGFERSSLEQWKIKHIDFSTEGRAEILCSVLNHLDVNRVDMVLSYSVGTWLGYKIAAEWDIVKAAGFLNPLGARPQSVIRPFIVIQVVARLLLIDWVANVMMSFMVVAYKILGFVDVVPGPHLIINQQMLANQGFKEMPGYAAKIAGRKLPIFIASCKNDKIAEIDITREMTEQHLSIPEENVIEYNQDDIPNKNPLEVIAGGWRARFLLFERGGHWVHRAHTVDVLEQIQDLLKQGQKHEVPS